MSAANTTSETANVAERISADERLIEREERAFARAAEADRNIKGDMHFIDWLALGEGLAALRDRALRESYSNKPFGKAYTQMYAKLREAHPWAKNYDATMTSHACWLHDNATDVLRWREQLGQDLREKWITARVVHEHYNRLTKVAEQKTPTASSASRENNAQTIIRLQEEVDLLRKKGGGGLLPGASVEEFVEAVATAHNARFMRSAAAALLKRAETEERQDKIEAGVKAKRKR